MPNGSDRSQSTLQRFGQRTALWAEKWVPSPLIFALVLTLVAYIAAILSTPDGPYQNIVNWYEGFWALLTFAMQMVLILVTGYAIAVSDRVSGFLDNIASLPNNGRQAAVFVAVVAMFTGYIHWGIGLITGAIFAIFVARAGYQQGNTYHYPLLCAAGYTSLLIFGVGLSNSAALLSATEGHVFEEVIGVVPLSRTVFTIYAFGLAVLTAVTVIILVYFMAPDEENAVGIEEYAPNLLPEEDEDEMAVTDGGPSESSASDNIETSTTPADRMNNSRILAYIISAGMLIYVVSHFATAGISEALNLNVFNFLFLAVGLALHGTPAEYMSTIREGVESSAGIILQFPFYAGILGILSNSGLATQIANFLTDIATTATFPVIAWLLAGFMNLFVPSAGGEWGVVGGVVSQAALANNVPPGQAIIAYSTGDMWTNMFQPFWALPLLGLTQVRARDILGYTLVILIVIGPVFALGLYFLPYLPG